MSSKAWRYMILAVVAGAAIVLPCSPASAAQPTLELTPASGAPGAQFTATYSVPSSSPCQSDPVDIGSPSPGYPGPGTSLSVWVRTTLNPDCTFTARVTVPNPQAPGSILLTADPHGSAPLAQARFLILAPASPSPQPTKAPPPQPAPATTRPPTKAQATVNPSDTLIASVAPVEPSSATSPVGQATPTPVGSLRSPVLADTPASPGSPMWAIGVGLAALATVALATTWWGVRRRMRR
jgi:hypothetical protein